jgi:hypothetical protein
VRPGAAVDAVEKRITPSPFRESNPGRPARRYPDSQNHFKNTHEVMLTFENHSALNLCWGGGGVMLL